MKYIKFFKELNNRDVPLVGGKNASLGEMYQELVPKGIKVPNGFAITSDAYWYLLESGGVAETIKGLLQGVDLHDLDVLKNISAAIRKLIFTTPIPKDLKKEILEAYKILGGEYGMKKADVAVRSSATAEDLPDASFAGQQDTYLNVKGESELIHYIKKCFASLFTDRAISYRASRGFDHFQVALSVGIQKMIRSDLGASGVMFSIDTESGFQDVVLITSSWGLGENVVGGTVIPDEFYVFKPTITKPNPILKRKLGKKDIKMVYSASGSPSPTHNIPTTKEEQRCFSITDKDVIELARYAIEIEKHYTKEAGVYRPMDMEWAKDGQSGEIYIVQARPETVQSQRLHNAQVLETYTLKAKKSQKELLAQGTAVGGKIGVGRVRIINSLDRINELQEGEVLVTDNTDPDWEPAMKKASAVVTNRGGRTCHAAIVAREIGVPTIVGGHDATECLQDGMEVTISCAEGEDGYVYKGALEYEVKQTDLSTLQESKTRIYMNIANPEKAFSFAQVPNDGVGLARMEFIINNYIKAHPLALVDMHEGKRDVADAKHIKQIASGYESPKEFFINRVAEGVGMIAAAFYPKPVVVRMSDFKSNEYKKMVGGAPYEPEEENPMLGFRGASRYYSKSYRPAFDWECEALKKVRDEMGLTNVKLMLPFVRTPKEGKKVLKIMAKNGLVQGENNLEVYVMCELPSNVLLAKEFLKIFDGFSIGSNDLTQLTLGVDRDSELVSFIFDERNTAVKKMLKKAISACRKADKYVGICGQAPSDYPEITEFLVKQGIDSISLNPDSILSMRHTVLEIESTLAKGKKEKKL
jgi:pyruvate,water dikinase